MQEGGSLMSFKKRITKYVKILSSLNLFFWSMIWLMILTTVGTIEQKNIGLFAAQEKYFSSFAFSFYGIPLPGGGLVIIILTLGLVAQLIFKTKFHVKKKIGVTLTHLGAIILLGGSMITYLLGTEGSLVLAEGETKENILDYRNYDLVIQKNDRSSPLLILPLKKSMNSAFKNSKILMTQIKVMPTCQLIPNENPNNSELGFAKMFKFVATDNKTPQEICTEIKVTKNSEHYIYRSFLYMPRKQSIEIDGELFELIIRNKEIKLPFKLKLLDFEKKFHQGTMISKSFKSIVEIQDESLRFHRTIAMNSPLRYKGYTFYQSSFSENQNGEISELSVVKNQAQWIPYISSIILCLGILIHLGIKIYESGTKR